MARGYSTELRQQVVAFLDEGHTVRQAAEKFGVSPSFAAKARKKLAEQADAVLPFEALAAEEAGSAALDAEIAAMDLADFLGVSKRAISDFADRGIIAKTGRNRFDLRRSIQLYCDHLRGVAAGRGGDGGDALATERARLAREQADKVAMENAASRRELITVTDVRGEWVAIARRIRNMMMSVPSRCRQMLPHLTTFDVDLIDREIRTALTELGEKDDDGGADDFATRGVGRAHAAGQAQTLGLDRADGLPA
ncbi:helix-turn-helix domain-containing protein [Kaistia nematophila]|uniref:Helix-turn-helix domain-containing protein n=1 Tax=Kaistia nematophila TaxID=2994654 RepID=A0A9X3E579_9HYPH|nr:helix-turn-helix domain-containing protein [Kaistia nematophila]